MTLVDAPNDRVWGVAFKVGRDRRDAVLRDLDEREIAGYDRLVVPAANRAGRVFCRVLTYRAGPTNPNFLGPAPMAAMVAQILASRGASGGNVEYVLELDRALRELGIADAHVAELANAVRSALAA